MKTKNKSLLFIFIILIFSVLTLAAETDSRLFSLQIHQNDKRVLPFNGIYYVDREPFILTMVLEENKTVYFNFDKSDILYNAELNHEPIKDTLGFGGTGLAEENGNPQGMVILTSGGWHVWPASDPYFMRFDSVKKNKGKVTAVRTIKSLYDTRTGSDIFETIEELYIVYCDVAFDNDYNYSVLQSDSIRMVFR